MQESLREVLRRLDPFCPGEGYFFPKEVDQRKIAVCLNGSELLHIGGIVQVEISRPPLSGKPCGGYCLGVRYGNEPFWGDGPMLGYGRERALEGLPFLVTTLSQMIVFERPELTSPAMTVIGAKDTHRLWEKFSELAEPVLKSYPLLKRTRIDGDGQSNAGLVLEFDATDSNPSFLRIVRARPGRRSYFNLPARQSPEFYRKRLDHG